MQVKVLIVVSGGTSNAQESRTLEDASQEPTNPADLWPTTQQVITTRVVRSAIVNKVVGTPAAQPDDPPYNLLQCAIASIVVGATGVISVSQITTNEITTLTEMAPVVAAMSGRLTTLESLTAGLLSSVAATALGLSDLKALFLAAIADLQSQINAIKSQASAPATATFRGQDNFQSLAQSNPIALGYNAVVSSGLRFGVANHTDTTYTARDAVQLGAAGEFGLVPLSEQDGRHRGAGVR